MTITSPSPNSSVYRVLSASSNSPPLPLPSSPPPPDPPFSEPNTTSPGGPPVPSAPPPLSPPSSESPPPMGSPAPPTTTPPPQASPPPTPPASNPPPSSSTPSKPSNPPPSSPQPKQSSPPPASPPPPSSNPPASPPPPAATSPPDASPPPASTTPPTPSSPSPPEPPNGALPPPGPPESSHPSPSTDRPNNSPATPSPNPPQNSRPSPGTKRPRSSPTPSVSGPPSDSTPPSFSSPGPESDSPPSPDDPSSSMPPPPIAELSPPSSLGSPPSPAGPSLVQPDAPTTNRSMTNAPNSSNSTAEGGIGTEGTVAICLTVSFLLLGVIATTTWFFLKRKKKVSGPTAGYVMPTSLGSSPQSDSALLKVQGSAANAGCGTGQDSVSSPPEPGGLGNSKCYFTYKELSEATNGFSAQYLLGEGGFGSVYKGCLADGREVAVKQLKVGGGQGDREFRAEVEIISRVHHRHLVSLVGYCISENRRLLVYDYVPNNTLHFHLHGEGKPVLGWAARVKIAVGAARGIAYLHEDCHPRIVHRDIKSSNILLDNNFEAQVSDFGLAKLFLDSNTHVTTRVVGTFGYMAPEYASSGKLTDKSDVFSFGVVLLELITGRKPVDTSQPVGEESLVEWARPLLSQALDTEEFDRLVDPRLEKCYVDNEMLLMIEAAAACVRHSSVKRPRMAQVVRAFDSMSTTDLSNGMRVGESEMFNNSAEKSAELRLFRKMAFGGSQDFSSGFYSKPSWKSEER